MEPAGAARGSGLVQTWFSSVAQSVRAGFTKSGRRAGIAFASLIPPAGLADAGGPEEGRDATSRWPRAVAESEVLPIYATAANFNFALHGRAALRHA